MAILVVSLSSAHFWWVCSAAQSCCHSVLQICPQDPAPVPPCSHLVACVTPCHSHLWARHGRPARQHVAVCGGGSAPRPRWSSSPTSPVPWLLLCPTLTGPFLQPLWKLAFPCVAWTELGRAAASACPAELRPVSWRHHFLLTE